jgi:DNA-binding HxlR family transcriptional regulator
MKLSECNVRVTIDVLEGKWKPLILHALKPGTQRYSDLRRSVFEPSEKVLIQQLRELEEDGIIDRVVYPEVPPRVEYSISPYGRSLILILRQMADWGEAHRERADAAGTSG